MLVWNQSVVNHIWNDDSIITAVSAKYKISVFCSSKKGIDAIFLQQFIFSHKMSIAISTFCSLSTNQLYVILHGSRIRIKWFKQE